MFKKMLILTLLCSLVLAQQVDLDQNQCVLFATPQTNIITKIVSDIDRVGKDGYIGIESPYLIRDDIIEALQKASRQGATVRVIVDQDEYYKNNYRYANLPNHGIEVLPINGLHAKRIVIDNRKNNPTDTIVYLGSMNLTYHAYNNLEIMVRCKDRQIFIDNLADQRGLFESPTAYRLTHYWEPRFNYLNIDFSIQRTLSSLSRNAQQTKLNLISEFPQCQGQNDYLYVTSFSLDDPQIIEALKQTAQKTSKPIALILDGKNPNQTLLDELSYAGIKVYLYNTQGDTTDQGSRKLFHMKVILRVCNGQCTAIISTGNLTAANRHTINHDLVIPCTNLFAIRLKRIVETAIAKSTLYRTITPPNSSQE